MIAKEKTKLKEMCKQWFDQMERQLLETHSRRIGCFYYRSSEYRIVLSRALLGVMTPSLKGKITKEKFFILQRKKYEEEMFDAFFRMTIISRNCCAIAT